MRGSKLVHLVQGQVCVDVLAAKIKVFAVFGGEL